MFLSGWSISSRFSSECFWVGLSPLDSNRFPTDGSAPGHRTKLLAPQRPGMLRKSQNHDNNSHMRPPRSCYFFPSAFAQVRMQFGTLWRLQTMTLIRVRQRGLHVHIVGFVLRSIQERRPLRMLPLLHSTLAGRRLGHAGAAVSKLA